MSKLLVKPTNEAGRVLHVTPESAGWTYVGFDLWKLSPGNKAEGHSLDREIGYLVAHGVLHVLGYDHEADADRRRMRAKEEEALRPLGFTR